MSDPTPPPVAPMSAEEEMRGIATDAVDAYVLQDERTWPDDGLASFRTFLRRFDPLTVRNLLQDFAAVKAQAALDREELVNARAQCGEAEGERTRLHKLVALARNVIDPVEHPEWDAEAYLELETCDTLGNRLQRAEDQIIREIAARDHYHAERDTLTQQLAEAREGYARVVMLQDETIAMKTDAINDYEQQLAARTAERDEAAAHMVEKLATEHAAGYERGKAEAAVIIDEVSRQRLAAGLDAGTLRLQVARLRDCLQKQQTRVRGAGDGVLAQWMRDDMSKEIAFALALTPDPGADLLGAVRELWKCADLAILALKDGPLRTAGKAALAHPALLLVRGEEKA